MRDGHADDVVQDVLVRLLGEFRRGKPYDVPYRVVVYQVVRWTIQDHFARRPTDVPLPETWYASVDEPGYGEIEREDVLERALARLAPGDAKVAELRWRRGLEIAEIAERLDVKRNAVDQALHRAAKRLREILSDG